MKGIVIGGTTSGSGKTTVTLGLMAALVKRGLRVAPFKVGPDFIDPGHHTRITGKFSRNLDGWMLSETYNRECFSQNAAEADIAVVEGVMGLFDGYDGRSEAGSTAQMAKWLGLPVLLVVNARSMARSAAALVQGFENFDRQLSFAGVLFNKLGSSRHLNYLTEALEGTVRMRCLGGLLRDNRIEMPERHLGLVTSEDFSLSGDRTERLVECIEQSIDIDALLASLPDIEARDRGHSKGPKAASATVRIGVAKDKAFCFYYPDNLDLLEGKGAELVFFSPMGENELPEDIDGLYIGGGYPELNAAALSENSNLRAQIRYHGTMGMPIYGECGGFMYLCRGLVDADGRHYPMADCFPFTTRMIPKLKSLGYREVTFLNDTVIGKSGRTARGHEFHYSEIHQMDERVDTRYSVSARNGKSLFNEGYQVDRVLGSYVHLHFGSLPGVAENFIDHCLKYRRERKDTNET